jgi:hypothetical protein
MELSFVYRPGTQRMGAVITATIVRLPQGGPVFTGNRRGNGMYGRYSMEPLGVIEAAPNYLAYGHIPGAQDTIRSSTQSSVVMTFNKARSIVLAYGGIVTIR